MRPRTTLLAIALLVPWGAPRAVAETEDAPLESRPAIQAAPQALGSGPR